MTRRAFSLPVRHPVYQLVRWAIILGLGCFISTVGLAIMLGDINFVDRAEAEKNAKKALEHDIVRQRTDSQSRHE
ncbi:MAG: hypothetical protein JSS83_22155 [Cyanobacteria bacterium SZAS LIN-3]|nr:hypothetical protein [Cyanobacteria bacterium SZAS LIN-3]MBS2005739.1 hypothetical protein [Cyanobacteria bacterium SZAS TMP-1]